MNEYILNNKSKFERSFLEKTISNFRKASIFSLMLLSANLDCYGPFYNKNLNDKFHQDIFIPEKKESNQLILEDSVVISKESITKFIDDVSRYLDIDENVSYSIIFTESSGNPNSISKEGAKGLMQTTMNGSVKEMYSFVNNENNLHYKNLRKLNSKPLVLLKEMILDDSLNYYYNLNYNLKKEISNCDKKRKTKNSTNDSTLLAKSDSIDSKIDYYLSKKFENMNDFENLAIGLSYFKILLNISQKKFKLDYDKDSDEIYRLALAMYNAGPTIVIKHGGIPPYVETRKYVNKIMNIRNMMLKYAITAIYDLNKQSNKTI